MSGGKPPVLARGLLARIALRGLLLQSSWNFERMQHLGFCFALLPLIRRLNPEPGSPARAEALRRHLEFFNTHPVMAAVILGAVVRLEAEGQGVEAQTAKLSLMGSYGAIGDSFFWGALRPAAGIAGLAAGLLWAVAGLPAGLGAAALVAPAVALAVFNVPQLWLRAFGVFAGAKLGVGVVRVVRRIRFPELTTRVRTCGALLLGLAGGPAAMGAGEVVEAVWQGCPEGCAWPASPAALAAGAALLLAAILAAFAVFARGVVPTRLAWLLAAVLLAAAVWP